MNAKTLSLDGVEIYVVEQGAGEPVVLLGGPWFGHYYLRRFQEELAKDFRVIAYDPRGSGRSSALSEDEINLDGHLKDLVHLQSGLNIPRINLLGHSTGALVSLLYAADHPGELASLVLVHPGPPFERDLQERLHLAFMSNHTPEDQRRMEELASTSEFETGDAQTLEEYFKVLYSPFFVNRANLDLLNFGFTPTTAQYALEAEERLLEQILGVSPVEKARQVDCATLVVHAGHDLIPEAFSRGLAASIPAAEFELLDAVGHFGYLEDPNRTLPPILDFLKRVAV